MQTALEYAKEIMRDPEFLRGEAEEWARENALRAEFTDEAFLELAGVSWWSIEEARERFKSWDPKRQRLVERRNRAKRKEAGHGHA